MGTTRGDALKSKLRLAFSHREKARRLAHECRSAFADGSIDQERYDALQRFYEGHLKTATEQLAQLRDAVDQALKQTHEALQQARQDRNALSAQVTAGQVAPKRANTMSRKLAGQIVRFKKELATLRIVATAESAADLGGFVDAPLEGYGEQPSALARIRPSSTIIIAFLLPVLTSLAVCLPWLLVGGRRISLLTAGTVLGTGLQGNGMQGMAAHLWVAYVTLPLTAIPFIGTRGYRKSGLAILLIGAAVLAASVLPAATIRGGAAQTIGQTQHVAMSLIGPVIYALGGVLLFVVALRRLFTRSSAESTWWRGAIGLAALALATMLALVTALTTIAAEEGTVAFTAQLTAAGSAARVTCRNRTLAPIALWIPAPEGGTPSREYGVSVHVLEGAEGRYRLFPSSGPCWTSEGVALGDAVEVAPGAFRTLTCNLGRLKSALPGAESVRLVFSQENRELSRFEAELPSRSSGQATGKFKRVPPKPNTIPSKQPAPRAEEPEPVPEPASEEPGIAVRFTGFMGGKAALRIAMEGEEREQVRFAQPGDEIGAGWSLHEIDEESNVLVMRHEMTQREVRIPRGPDSVILKP